MTARTSFRLSRFAQGVGGGPPARGGGDTYLFYAALGRTVESNQIQMTVQGQTISSHYGIKAAATHNLSQLLTAGVEIELPKTEAGAAVTALSTSVSAAPAANIFVIAPPAVVGNWAAEAAQLLRSR